MRPELLIADTLNSPLSQDITRWAQNNLAATVWQEAQTATPHSVLVLLVSQYHEAEQQLWVERAQQQQLLLLPLRLSANGWQLGPVRQLQSDACLCCAQSWEQKNHPQKQYWPALHQAADMANNWPTPPLTLELITSQLQALVAQPAQTQNQLLAGQYLTMQSQWHQLLQNPHCPVCNSLEADNAKQAAIELQPVFSSAPGQYRRSNDKLSEANLRAHFVDPRYGLVKHLYKSSNARLVPMVCSEMPLLGELAQENSYGRTTRLSDCYKVSILEALERFAGHAPRNRKTVVRDSFRNLEAAIDPRQFVLHDPDDGSKSLRVVTDYHDDLVHNWVWAHSFASADSRLIPEQLAYYRLQNQPDAPINRYVYECSNGCALGSSREEAILYGLFEVIERDAYLTTWYGRIPPVALDLSTALDPQIRLLHAQASALGYELYVFDITMESKVPAVWAMLINPAADAKVKSYCAAGAHIDPEKAVMSALVEVMTSMMVYEESLPGFAEKAAAMLADVSLVRDMADHVLLYAQAETLDWLSFLFTSAPAVSLQQRFAGFYQQPAEQNLTLILQQVIQRCVAAYGDVLVVDQSFAALAPLELHAVKVLVPNTHTITFGHQYQRVSLARVNQARAARKLATYADRQALNVHVPHNFP